uniref:Neurotransmitter-gated ion-channel transmembrane domain-containing protein n=1 Tax=Ciona savignyi TaxID=51511 RepID=H2Y7S6_CIOSA
MEYAGVHFTVRRYASKATKLSDGKIPECEKRHKNRNQMTIEVEKDSAFGNSTSDQRENEKMWNSASITRGSFHQRTVPCPEAEGAKTRGFGEQNSSFLSRKRNCGIKRVSNGGCVVTKIQTLRHRAIRLERIDEYSRIIFPLSFAAFNVVYWWVYLTMDDQ